MRYEKIHLKEKFAFLGEEGRDPVLELYLPEGCISIQPAAMVWQL